MDNKFNSLKEVYDSCKDLVTGEFKYLESNEERERPCITWIVSEDLSVYIEADCLMIARGSTEIHSEFLESVDYLKIYNLIREYDGEFRRNPDYGKKEIKTVHKSLYFVIGIFLTIIVTVLILTNL